jgi:F-type H+-transporting ATPase subunit epsilon
MAFSVELVSPEGGVFSGEATMVLARTPEGEIAFQQGHIPFIGVLSGAGPTRIWLTDGTVLSIAVHSGFVQVSGDSVTILSDVAELPDQIDAHRAEEARRRATEMLDRLRADGRPADDPDIELYEAALQRANLRLQVAGADTAPAANRGGGH